MKLDSFQQQNPGIDIDTLIKLSKHEVGGYVAATDGIIQRNHDSRPNQSLILKNLASFDKHRGNDGY